MSHYIQKTLEKYIEGIIERSSESIQIKVPGIIYPYAILKEAMEGVIKKESSSCTITIKFASQLIEYWGDDIALDIKRNHSQWIDDTGNLTSYRNQIAVASQKSKNALIIVGYDLVNDKSSLDHFLDANLDTLYEIQLNRTFDEWIGKANTDASNLLNAVYKFTDLVSLDEYLSNLALTDNLIVFEEIANNLDQLNLPCFKVKITGARAVAKYAYYLNKGLSILNGSFLLDSNATKKARESVAKLKEIFDRNDYVEITSKENAKKLYENSKYYEGYDDVYSYLEDCERLLDEGCPSDIKDRIRKTDCNALVSLVYNFKEKTRGPVNSEKKVSGSPLQAILSALWNSFADVAKQNDSILPEIKSVAIKPVEFTHNVVNSDEADATAENDLIYKEKINPLLGGLAEFIDTEIFKKLVDDESLSIFENTQFNMYFDKDSWEQCGIRRTQNIPYFKFEILVYDADDNRYQITYRCEYRTDSPISYSIDLIRNVRELIKKNISLEVYWPTFTMAKYAEMYDKTDEEIGIFFAGEAGKEGSIGDKNLASILPQTDDELVKTIKAKLKDIFALFYDYCNAVDSGLYYAVLKKNSFCNDYNELLELLATPKYSTPALSSFKQAFAKSFFIIDNISDDRNTSDALSSSIFGDGIVTLLHPLMIDMFHAQIYYLAASFIPSFKEAFLAKNSDLKNANKILEQMISFAAVSNPVPCIMKNDEKIISFRGYDLLYMIGKPAKDESARPSSVLCRYEDDINVADIKKSSQESDLIRKMLEDYYNTYMMARDSLRISVVLADEIQPIIAGILDYVEFYYKKRQNFIESNYRLDVTFYCNAAAELNTTKWVNTTNAMIASEIQKEESPFNRIKINFSSRIIGDKLEAIRQSLDDCGFDSDITFVYESDTLVNKVINFYVVDEKNALEMKNKFPLTTKLIPCKLVGDKREYSKKRKSFLANRQFAFSESYLKFLYSLRNKLEKDQDIVVEQELDFSEWNVVLNICINQSERVIAIGSDIDRALIEYADTSDENTTIIGAGSGVGSNADLNYVVASRMAGYTTLEKRLADKFAYKFSLPINDAISIINNLRNANKKMSDLSLIKAISNKSLYCHDFFGYSMIRHLLKAEKGCFTDVLLSMDSFKHWFKPTDKRADLLWVRAHLTKDAKGRDIFSIKLNIVESKLGSNVANNYLAAAAHQVSETHKYLSERFSPSSDRFDARYWWMQLHRIIASNSVIDDESSELVIKNALENLADGIFSLEYFDCGVIAFETNSYSNKEHYIHYISENLKVTEIVITRDGVANLMTSDSSKTWEELYKEITSEPAEIIPDGVDVANDQKRKSNEEIKNEIYAEESFYGVSYGYEASSREDNEFKYSIEETEEKNINVSVEDATYTTISHVVVDGNDEEDEDEDRAEVKDETEVSEQSAQETVNVLPAGEYLYAPKDTEILLGKDARGNDIYWYFGSEFTKVPNKHMLVIGGSGSGKSYAIKCILTELARANQASVIVDYTTGFSMGTLKKEIAPDSKVNFYSYVRSQYSVKKKPLPLNPFALAKYPDEDEEGEFIIEKPYDVATRATDVICHKFILGDVQKGNLIKFLEKAIAEYGEDLTMAKLGELLEEEVENNKHSNLAGVSNKLLALYKNYVFDKQIGGQSIWEAIFKSDGSEKAVSVIQLKYIPDIVAYTAVDFILWDLYNYSIMMNYSEKAPHVIVLDEFQNLSLDSKSPVRKMLQEGRKRGLNLILATQSLSVIKGQDGNEALSSIFNAATILFFRPNAPDVRIAATNANKLDPSRSVDEWSDALSNLQKGDCIVMTTNKEGRMVGRKIHITSLGER